MQINIFALCSNGEILHGFAEKEAKRKNDKIFTGDVEVIHDKNEIKMTVSQVLSAGVTEEGDEFFAEVTQEVEGKKGVMLPVGTIAHGKVKGLKASKRLAKDGWIELSFDYLITPDGREIPIQGYVSTKLSPAKQVLKTTAQTAGFTVVGGLMGGFMALQLLGLEAAIASQGWTVAGGAAIGGTVGLGVSLIRKGEEVLIAPGDEIRLKVMKPLELPVLAEHALRQDEIFFPGLDVKINEVKTEKDPFGQLNTITMNLVIDNKSSKKFSSFDIGMVSELNTTYHPSIFHDSKLNMTTIKPGDKVSGSISFSVDNPKRKHWLVFYDTQTKKPLAKISVDNAKRELKTLKVADKKSKTKTKEKTALQEKSSED